MFGDEPQIDGDLSDEAWRRASLATNFMQLRPDEGEAASERTEVRVLYGQDALFVSFRAFDREAHRIEGQLTRRDQESFSDRVHVLIDSYNDNRTAFHFAVNPRGVKQDSYRFDDTDEDTSWDAVWDVATSVDNEGWSAEFAIPYSQLRFPQAETQTWGINFQRDIARKNETSFWAPVSGQDNAVVSKFGELRSLQGIAPPRRLEVTPSSLARIQRAPGDADVNGDGNLEYLGNPNFNFKQFRTNAVLRWEYRPGSTFFIVWSQGRNQFSPSGDFDFRSDLGTLFKAPTDDVLMVKFTYWLNP